MSTMLTGEYPSITLSAQTTRPKRESSRGELSRSKRLLSDDRPIVVFGIDFWDGDRQIFALGGSGYEPTWWYTVLEEIKRLARLAPNWDSYGSVALTSSAVERCLTDLLPVIGESALTPHTVPTPAGGLQLEWHSGACSLEIQVPPSGAISYSFFDDDAKTEHSEQGPPARFAGFIQSAIARLSVEN